MLPPYTQDMWQIECQKTMFEGIDMIKFWHVCYGSVDGQRDVFDDHAAEMMPLFEASPADVIHLEFTSTEFGELDAFGDVPEGQGARASASSTRRTRSSRRPSRSPTGSAARSRWSPPDRLLVAPDCGLGYFSRTTAYAKLRNMGQAADEVRKAL